MIKRIKVYLEYRKNKKYAKKELIRITATILPVVKEISDKAKDIVQFLVKLTNEAKNIEDEKLFEMVLSEISTVLQSDNIRIIEILTYIANLRSEDIQKILTDSVSKSMHINVKDT